VEWDRRRQALNLEFIERTLHTRNGRSRLSAQTTSLASTNRNAAESRNQRKDDYHAHSGTTRSQVLFNRARLGTEIGLRIFRSDTALDGVTAKLDLVLLQLEWQARRDADLFFLPGRYW